MLDNVKRLVPQRVAVSLLGIALGLLLAHVWSHVSLAEGSTWEKLLDLNNEKNFATGFSASLLLSCSGLLGLIAWQYQTTKVTISHKTRFLPYWWALSLVFLGMAGDEWLLMHERINNFLDDDVQLQTSGFFYYDWVIVGLIFVAAIALIYARFLKHLPTQTRRQFLLAGSIYVAGVLGMEMISGYYIDLYGRGNRAVLAVLHGIEEVTEMVGLIVFIWALLTYYQLVRQSLASGKRP